jgi:hypothetical protein
LDEKLMLVTLLHDAGKIMWRAGKEPHCQLGKEFHEHDRLTCDFLSKYLGEEYVKIFREGKWKVGDYASASERIESESLGSPALTPLLDPTLEISSDLRRFEDQERWYTVTYVDFNDTVPETYKAKTRREAGVNYRGILEKLEELAEKARHIRDPESLLETYDYIYRTTALFVPAAVYKAVPNTSLYGHSRLAAPLAICERMRLLLIDIKRIQRFITNVKGEKESSKRLRGRSIFLQLLQTALADRIAGILGLSTLHNISFEPGKLMFAVCGDVKGEVNDILTEIERWSDYELQFASSISEEFQVSKMKIFNKDEGDEQFRRVLEDAFSKLKIVGRPGKMDLNMDYFRDLSSKTLKRVEGVDRVTAGEVNEDDLLSEINLISLIVGHSTRNLHYVVEVLYKNDVDKEFYYHDNVGKIFIEPLRVGFLLVHGDKEISFLKSLIQTEKDKAERIRVFTVNETVDFIYPDLLKEFDRISFGYMTLSTHHPVENDKFLSLDDFENYIAMGVVDGDRIGELVRRLSAFPGRFMTFSTLLDFAFAHIVAKKAEEIVKKTEEIGGNDTPRSKVLTAMLYSGGDDLAVYGKWDEVFKLLMELSSLIVGVIPSISVSGGIFVFKKKYPIAFAYSYAREEEKRAKAEREGNAGRVSSNILERYALSNDCRDIKQVSLTWDEASKFLKFAEKLSKSDVPSAYLYKLYTIGQMIENCEIPKALVTYAYLNARNDRTFENVRKNTDDYLLDYPKEGGDKIIPVLLKFRDVINMYSLLARS